MLRSDVAVDNDNGLLALGNSNGSVEVYSLKTLRLIYTANNQTNTINCMTWKPKGGMFMNDNLLQLNHCILEQDSMLTINRPCYRWSS
jgi:WD40 repeat protein